MAIKILDKGYEPRDIETRWYEYWEKNSMFSASEKSEKDSYSIVIPPPNITGRLHMGHALNNTLQDILCRYKRLCGYNVLWMPGTDHAGIATQNVVEKNLAQMNTDRHQLGREGFIDAVWKWRNEYGQTIIEQLKRLGASCDWPRERFTMDEGLSRAVRKVFVKLYHEGLIYQGDYITNWCPRCHTAISDLEVEHKDHEASLYHIKYPYVNGDGGIVVATTRPETMLGDTAVAVNPSDERYQNLTANEVILPLTNRTIPIIRDTYVDMSFGTGGLKVTPAHDSNDFEIGQRHNLPTIKVIKGDGTMSAEAGKFAGLDRFECRDAVIKDLKNEGFLVNIEPYTPSLGHCYRCDTIVEPSLTKQWFVKVKPLAEKAIAAVKNGDIRIIPHNWNRNFFDWMDNIRDWCISRQIWWGHRIPVWTCNKCNSLIVAIDTPEKCETCQSRKIEQEEDVEKIVTRIDQLEKMIINLADLKNRGFSKNSHQTSDLSATGIVLDIIKRHNKEITFKVIQEKTGFGEKKIRNIIFRLAKTNRITRISRGVYKLADNFSTDNLPQVVDNLTDGKTS